MDEEVKPTGPPPWERAWNSVKESTSQAIETIANTVATKDETGARRMPWERDYTAKPRVIDKTAPTAPVAPTNAIDGFLVKLSGVESGNVADAKNPNSSASGLFQFTASTWKEAVAAAGKDYTLADRNDPVKAREIATSFTQANRAKAVSDLGREPQGVELYMYHFLGRNAAGDFLNAPRDKPATDYVSGSAARANKSVFYSGGKPRTVDEVLNLFKGKF